MQITAIRVAFSRRVSPAQYESMGAEVDLNILVEPNQSTESLIAEAGALAKAKVYEMLGLKAPSLAPVPAVASSSLPTSAAVAPIVETSPKQVPQAEASAEPAKRTRRTKAEMEAARAAETTATKASTTIPERSPASLPTELFADESMGEAQDKTPFHPASLATDEDPLGLNIPTTAPATPASQNVVVEEDWEKPQTMSLADFSAKLSKLAAGNPKAATRVKEWKIKHSAPMAKDLPPALWPELIKELEAL